VNLGMNTLQKLNDPTTRTTAFLLLALQAAIGMPFLLTIMGGFRHWSGWFSFRNPR